MAKYLIIIVSVLICYYQILSGLFLEWDDFHLILNNPFLKAISFSHFISIWTSVQEFLFIPIVHTIWFALISMTGLNPFYFHLVNLLVHILNCLILYHLIILFLSFFKKQISHLPVFLVLLFAVHPANVESVAWISGLKEISATFFGLIAIYLFLDNLVRPKFVLSNYCFSILFFACSLLCKPSFIMLPFCLFFIVYFLNSKNKIDNLKLVLPFAVISLSVSAFTIYNQSSNILLYVPAYHLRLLVVVDTIIKYLQMFFIPISQMPDHGRTPQLVVNFSFGWHLLNISSFIFLLFLSWRTSFLKWFLLFIITIFPLTGIVPFFYQQTSTIADRYLYFPAIWLVIGMAVMATNVFIKYQRQAIVLLSFLILLLGIKTFIIVPNWKDDISFFGWMLSENKQSFTALNHLGDLARNDKNNTISLDYYRKSIQIADWQPYPRLCISSILISTGKIIEGKKELDDLLSMYPMYDLAENYKKYLIEKKILTYP